ncbi:MAG: hypothetical protein CMJ78_22255 [Planctomycetaceae bacterium]|nr:hypothetical protein [Planctomycetaceae bacterium]
MIRFCALKICIAILTLFAIAADISFAEEKALTAKIIHRGIIDCFPEGLTSDDGKPVYAETSAIAFDGKQLYFASDKPLPGEGRSVAFSIAQERPFAKVSNKPLKYLTESPFLTARKFEDFSVTPDRGWIFATTGFDRIIPDSTKFHPYNTLMVWPAGKPEDVKIIDRSEIDGVISSIGIRKKLAAGITTGDFPKGVPDFKIEGLMALPGNKLLFGVREQGKKYDDFAYAIRMIQVDYKVGDNGVTVLGRSVVAIIHDDDRVLGRDDVKDPETQFSRKKHQAAFSVVCFNSNKPKKK